MKKEREEKKKTLSQMRLPLSPGAAVELGR